FTIASKSPVNKILEEFGITSEPDGSLLLVRELTVQGKNLCRVNGRTVTLTMLRELTKHLVDVHGQHQHQYLLNTESHIDFIDQFGKNELDKEKSLLKEKYHEWKKIEKEIKRIKGINKDGVRQMDLLLYQINEISEANLALDEEENLKNELNLLLNAEKVINSTNCAYQNLYTGSMDNPSIMDKLAEVIKQLETAKEIDKSLEDIVMQLNNMQFTLEDVTIMLRDYKDNLNHEPSRIEEIEERLQQIKNLKRKYGNSIREILDFKDKLEAEYQMLEDSQSKLEKLESECNRVYTEVLTQCKKISNIRRQYAKKLEKDLVKQLKDLNMNEARFSVLVQEADLDSDQSNLYITENGYDTVEFLISANPGEPLKPLAKIISGGEMSRVMLALKTILGDKDQVPTMIFDEIDVGISGHTAQKVAEKIGKISKQHQVITVTHLPQIASMADRHFEIHKVVKKEQTNTQVTELTYEERIRTIARMLGGVKITDLSLGHARDLIESANIAK
ncbi:MAG: DNA repair protein RecN, partial [Eubacteriales bacterium]